MPKRIRQLPRRIDDGCAPHIFTTPEEYFHQQFFQVLLTCELDPRFNQETLKLLKQIENLVISAANGDVVEIPNEIRSLYAGDFNSDRLHIHLSMLKDLLKTFNQRQKTTPSINKVTKLSTVVEILGADEVACQLLAEADELIRLYLTIPMSNATAEQSSSAMRRIKTYLRSTMSQKHMNHVMFLHVHRQF
ncbi:UNVERIFIED_CONTAM: hypothetical protein FKN15_039286 [Acipenser sinensis]